MTEPQGRLLSLDDNQTLRSIQFVSGQKLTLGIDGLCIASNQNQDQNIICEIIYEYGQMHIKPLIQDIIYFNQQKLGINNQIIIKSGDILMFKNNQNSFEYVYVAQQTNSNQPQQAQEQQVRRVQNFEIDQELQCPICYDIFYQPVILHKCGHIFCGACVSIWMQNSNECPSCRRIIHKVTNATTLNSLLDRYLQANPDKEKVEEEKQYYKEHNIYQDQADSSQSNDDMEDSISDTTNRSDLSESRFLSTAISLYQAYSERTRLQAVIVSQLIDQRNNSRYPLIDCQSCNGASYNGFRCDEQTQHTFCCACNQRKMPIKQLTLEQNQVQKMYCQICLQYYCYYYYNQNCRKQQRVFNVLSKWKGKMERDNNYISSTETIRLVRHGKSDQAIFDHVMQRQVNYGRFSFRRSLLKPEDRHNLVDETLLLPNSPICQRCFKFLTTQIFVSYVYCVKNQEEIFQKQNCRDGIVCRFQGIFSHAEHYNHLCYPQLQ